MTKKFCNGISIKEGQKYYVGLTNEGKYLQYILENPETSGSS